MTVSQTAALLTGAGQRFQLSARATTTDGAPVPVTWRSSDPSQVTVDADGIVTAVAGLGSAIVFAEAGDEWAPVTVLIAQPAAGALLVDDDQVLSEPEPVGPVSGMLVNGTRMRLTLSGMAPPATGTIVLATGSAAIGGRVVGASASGDVTTVEYELVPLPALLARYSIDLDVPLDVRDVARDEAAGAITATLAAAGAITATLAAAGMDGGVRLAADLEAKKEAEFKKGPLECSASASAQFKSTDFDIKATSNLSLQVEGRKEQADASVPEHTRVVLTGPLALDVFGGLRAEAGFEGKAECALVKHIPIPLGGILAVVLAITVPIGLSASAEGKITAVSVEFGPKGHLGTTVTVGFQCDSTACWAITDQVPDANNGISFETKLDVLRNMRVEAGVALNVVTGLGARFGEDYSLIDAKIGPVQSLDLAFDDDQVREPAYASAYDLKIVGSVTPGDDLKSAISRIFGGEVTLDLSVKYTPEKPLAQSPVGVLSAEKTRVQVDKPVKLFVDLDPKTVDYFLIGPNVAEVRIARWKDNTLHPLTTIPVAASGQTRFEWTWTPGKDFLGMNELVAFVVTNLLPAIPLEIKADSTAYVEVVDACLPEGTPPPPKPPVPGSSAGASVPPAAPTPTLAPDPCGAAGSLTFSSETRVRDLDGNNPTTGDMLQTVTMDVAMEEADDGVGFRSVSGSWEMDYAFDSWIDKRFNGGADGCIYTAKAAASFSGSWDEESRVELFYDPESLQGSISVIVVPTGAYETTEDCPGLGIHGVLTSEAGQLTGIGVFDVQGTRQDDRIVFEIDDEHVNQSGAVTWTFRLTGTLTTSLPASGI